jgi:hypothetical protein
MIAWTPYLTEYCQMYFRQIGHLAWFGDDGSQCWSICVGIQEPPLIYTDPD